MVAKGDAAAIDMILARVDDKDGDTASAEKVCTWSQGGTSLFSSSCDCHQFWKLGEHVMPASREEYRKQHQCMNCPFGIWCSQDVEIREEAIRALALVASEGVAEMTACCNPEATISFIFGYDLCSPSEPIKELHMRLWQDTERIRTAMNVPADTSRLRGGAYWSIGLSRIWHDLG